GGGSQVQVIRMGNVLTATPSYTVTPITVTSFGLPPSAPQLGSSDLIQTNDARILNAAWRNNQLVAAQTVGTGGVAHARWYAFDTSTSTPALSQSGEIAPGAGVYTYFPSVEIASGGDVGMTFMQSSTSQYMSMYVTGQKA